ncbi:MAG: S41 family peptidase, partial [Acholeplasmatales bacterium]|nr:S41 family peptidase [Acholeplasmatales bacterium]
GTESQIFDSNGNVLDTAKDYDSYYYMLDAMNQINAKGNIKHVVLDITRSGGGNIAAMIRIMGFLTDAELKITQYCDFGEMAITSYYSCDTDLDGSYKDADAYTNYTWALLTSSYTYSAANTLTSIISNQKICKIYGEATGGGMCSIMPIVMLDGSTMYISSYLKSAVRKLDEIIDIEAGISPDIEVNRSSFYDDSYIDSLFN